MQTECLVAAPLQMQLTWKQDSLQAIHICQTNQESCSAKLSPLAMQLFDQLQKYVCGKPVNWPELPLAWSNLPSFSRRVLSYIHSELKWGEWLSYSRLAELCDNPRAARAVGMAMSRNPWPLVVPCHRVLAKKKRIGGFSSGTDLKKFLLSLEGIQWS